MSDFSPSEGWVPWKPGTPLPTEHVMLRQAGMPDMFWVREPPVPPLPTEDGSVIEVTWGPDPTPGAPTWWARKDSIWQPVGRDDAIAGDTLHRRITGWKPLAAPRDPRWDYALDRRDVIVRRDTAKAVIDRVRERLLFFSEREAVFDEVASDFKVEP